MNQLQLTVNIFLKKEYFNKICLILITKYYKLQKLAKFIQNHDYKWIIRYVIINTLCSDSVTGKH